MHRNHYQCRVGHYEVQETHQEGIQQQSMYQPGINAILVIWATEYILPHFTIEIKQDSYFESG